MNLWPDMGPGSGKWILAGLGMGLLFFFALSRPDVLGRLLGWSGR